MVECLFRVAELGHGRAVPADGLIGRLTGCCQVGCPRPLPVCGPRRQCRPASGEAGDVHLRGAELNERVACYAQSVPGSGHIAIRLLLCRLRGPVPCACGFRLLGGLAGGLFKLLTGTDPYSANVIASITVDLPAPVGPTRAKKSASAAKDRQYPSLSFTALHGSAEAARLYLFSSLC
jgi:hypothetical protein